MVPKNAGEPWTAQKSEQCIEAYNNVLTVGFSSRHEKMEGDIVWLGSPWSLMLNMKEADRARLRVRRVDSSNTRAARFCPWTSSHVILRTLTATTIMADAAAASLDIKQLLGRTPSSLELSTYLLALAATVSKQDATIPDVKSYSDAVYFNYFMLGLSLLFKPINGYKPKTNVKREELKDADLVLDGVDVYNVPTPEAAPASGSKLKPTHATYPISPLTLSLSSESSENDSKQRPAQMTINPGTTGKEFVETMGEPDRKGGGAGPSSGSIGIWCEWSKDGVMVEFGGDESRGPQAWERGKDAVWKVVTIFPPK
ncbi:hypothetical protein IEO21_00074 [Rhodonia placenta]|uniref:Uncharacterized protein n=1 Tax=Rhodonia placenta TaxID=104341 RepID=A0A8H7PC18_9APHY|nr:hypothetical protein IEO21_00074 [Postia placenta]